MSRKELKVPDFTGQVKEAAETSATVPIVGKMDNTAQQSDPSLPGPDTRVDYRKHVGKMVTIPVSMLKIGGNVRQKPIDTTSPDFLALVKSIKEAGQLQNILAHVIEVNGVDELQTTIGQRRLLAIKAAGIDRVAVKILEGGTEKDRIKIGVAENMLRANLEPVDIGSAFLALHQMGDSLETIGMEYGLSPKSVSNYIWVGKLPEAAQDIINDQPEVFTIKALNTLPRELAQKEELLVATLKDMLGQAERQEKSSTKAAAGFQQRKSEMDFRANSQLAQIANAKATVTRKRGKVRVTLLFNNDEAYRRFFDKLTSTAQDPDFQQAPR
jgi:ParB/RepB/Spo0J family partition protein